MSKVLALKGSILSLSVLKIYTDDIEQIRQTLEQKIQQAPEFFKGLPIVIEPEIEQVTPTFLALLVEYLHQKSLVLVGLRTDQPCIKEQAEFAGLAILNPSPRAAGQKSSSQNSAEPSNTVQGALVIEGAVRSGQQVYAKGRDLIVRGSINPGAEVVADGHVHVYGRVKGKVFAGSQGDQQARIYAKSLDAEMVCIAGLYQMSDDIAEEFKQDWVEVRFENQTLKFNKL